LLNAQVLCECIIRIHPNWNPSHDHHKDSHYL
jgi:hypothetical protein